MTDFAALIDRAIASRTRGRLAEHLATYQHVEFGLRRQLNVEEAALVLTAIDAFHLDEMSVSLGVAELRSLYGRLATLAAKEDDLSAGHVGRLRNACFDALASLKAFEARVSGLLDQQAIGNTCTAGALSSANDA